jgi:tricorn protease
LRRSNVIALLFTVLLACTALAQTPRLFRAPSLSDTSIAFRYADDVWIVPRAGGAARRLTSTGNVDGGPFFSPDGQTVAYDANVNGAIDVYTIPADGGVPKQITYHPGGNSVVGWTPDGHDLLFISMRHAFRTYFQMFRVHADGSGLPEQLPLPSAYNGSLSPDGTHLAYNPPTHGSATAAARRSRYGLST